MSQNEEKNTDNLINQLCGDLEPVAPRCPYRQALVWLVLSVIYIAFVIFYYGINVDLETKMLTASFIFEMSMALAILVSSALASSWLSFPDGIQRPWLKATSLTLFGSFLLWIVASMIEEGGITGDMFISSCSRALLVDSLPFIALVIMTARGKTTQPYWSMTMNVMAVSALGWIGLRLTCSMYDSMSYGLMHYLLPFSILGVAVGFFSRKIFKW